MVEFNVPVTVKAVVMILPTTVVLQMSIEVCTTVLMTRSLGRFVLCLYLCCDCTCTVTGVQTAADRCLYTGCTRVSDNVKRTSQSLSDNLS